jgi:hypothetical protein
MSNEKQQTAVEWYIENLNHLEMKKSLYKPIDFRIKKQRIIDQAKEIGKTQIEKAYDDAIMKGRQEDGEQYYEQTYAGNK